LKPLVLVADDDPDVCWALDHVLHAVGVQCICALDGRAALEMIRHNHLTLALLDAKLPDIDGLELAHRMRAAQPDIPIVVISGYFYKDDPTIQGALEQGLIQGFIEKPFLHSEVVEIVKGGLSLQQTPSRMV